MTPARPRTSSRAPQRGARAGHAGADRRPRRQRSSSATDEVMLRSRTGKHPAADRRVRHRRREGRGSDAAARLPRAEAAARRSRSTQFRDQWPPAAVLPATQQHVDAVPLGRRAARGTSHVAIYGHMFGNLDKDGSGGQIEGQVVASFDRIRPRSRRSAPTSTPRCAVRHRLRLPARACRCSCAPRCCAGATRPIRRSRSAGCATRRPRSACSTAVAPRSTPVASSSRRTAGSFPIRSAAQPDTRRVAVRHRTISTLPTGRGTRAIAVNAHGSTWNGTLDERLLSLAASANKDDTVLQRLRRCPDVRREQPVGRTGRRSHRRGRERRVATPRRPRRHRRHVPPARALDAPRRRAAAELAVRDEDVARR